MTATREDYVDALASSFGDEGTEILGAGGLGCLTSNFVNIVGVDELKAAGVSPQEFATNGDLRSAGVDEAKANELFDQRGCVSRYRTSSAASLIEASSMSGPSSLLSRTRS